MARGQESVFQVQRVSSGEEENSERRRNENNVGHSRQRSTASVRMKGQNLLLICVWLLPRPAMGLGGQQREPRATRSD